MSAQRILLITGATAGIGRAAALTLAREGYRVFAAGRNEKALAEIGAVENIEGLRMDVTDETSVRAAHERVLAQTGGHGVDVIVNNAGYAQTGPLIEMEDALLKAQFATNVFGLMSVTRIFSAQMMARREGRVVNVSAGFGHFSFPGIGAYAASKYSLEALSDALRIELKPFGIRVVLVTPGPVKTEFADVAIGNLTSAIGEDSSYSKLLARTRAVEKRAMSVGVDPRVVVDGIRKGIERRRPAARYATPPVLGLIFGVAPIIPPWITDFLAARVTGLSGKLEYKGTRAKK